MQSLTSILMQVVAFSLTNFYCGQISPLLRSNSIAKFNTFQNQNRLNNLRSGGENVNKLSVAELV